MHFVILHPLFLFQIRLGYATDLTEKGLLPSLFTNVFRLMPENPVLCLKKGGGVDTPKKEDLRTLFLRPCAMHTGNECNNVYFSIEI